MIRRKSIVFVVMRILAKLGLLVLQVMVEFASDKRSKPRYVAMKAKELHDEGLISDAELSKSIYGSD